MRAQDVARLKCLRGIDTLVGGRARASRSETSERFEHPGLLASLSRARALRAQLRRLSRRQGLDHQGRLQARQPPAGRGGMALPPPAPARHDARAPPATAKQQALIAIAWKAQQRLHRPSGAGSTRTRGKRRTDRRGRGRPPARRLLLGDRHPRHRRRRGPRPDQYRQRPCRRGDPLTHAAPNPEAHTNHPQETHQLTLTPSDTPLRLARRPEHPGSRTPTPRSVA